MPEQLSVTPETARTSKKKPAAQLQAVPADTTQAGGLNWTKMLEMGVPAAALIAGLISGSRATGKKRAAVGRGMQGFGQALMQLTHMKEQSRQATATGLARTQTAEAGARAAEETAKAKADADARKAEIDADKERRRRWEKDLDIAQKFLFKFPDDPVAQRMYMEMIGAEPRAPKKTPDYGDRANLFMDEQDKKVPEGTFEGVYGTKDSGDPDDPTAGYSPKLKAAYDVMSGELPQRLYEIVYGPFDPEEASKYSPQMNAWQDVVAGKLTYEDYEKVYGKEKRPAPSTEKERNYRRVYRIPPDVTIQEASKKIPALAKALKRDLAIATLGPLIALGIRTELDPIYGDREGAGQLTRQIVEGQWSALTGIEAKPPERYPEAAAWLSSRIENFIQQGTPLNVIESSLRESGYNPFSEEWRTHIEPALNDYRRQFREAAEKAR